MFSIVARLAGWVRRTTAFVAAGGGGAGTAPNDAPTAHEPIYRLRQWPELPRRLRTAAVLRLLSVMSTRPVNRGWMLRHSGIGPELVDHLLDHLQRGGNVDVIDPSGFGPLPGR